MVLQSVLLAYIDPVSGSIILQALIAAGVGGVAFFRRTIGQFLRRIFRRDTAAAVPIADPAEPDDRRAE